MEYDSNNNPYQNSANGGTVDTQVKSSKCSTNYSLPIIIKLTPSKNFTRLISYIDPDDPEQMIYKKLNAYKKAVLIYIRPVGINVLQRRTRSLYTLFVRRGQRPTSRQHHFSKLLTLNDWSQELGFKIFVHKGICGKNDCYLGLKPLNGEYACSTVTCLEATDIDRTNFIFIYNYVMCYDDKVYYDETNNFFSQYITVLLTSNITVSSVKRQADNSTQNTKSVFLLQVKLDAIVTTVGCSAQRNDSWEEDVCHVRKKSASVLHV